MRLGVAIYHVKSFTIWPKPVLQLSQGRVVHTGTIMPKKSANKKPAGKTKKGNAAQKGEVTAKASAPKRKDHGDVDAKGPKHAKMPKGLQEGVDDDTLSTEVKSMLALLSRIVCISVAYILHTCCIHCA